MIITDFALNKIQRWVNPTQPIEEIMESLVEEKPIVIQGITIPMYSTEESDLGELIITEKGTQCLFTIIRYENGKLGGLLSYKVAEYYGKEKVKLIKYYLAFKIFLMISRKDGIEADFDVQARASAAYATKSSVRAIRLLVAKNNKMIEKSTKISAWYLNNHCDVILKKDAVILDADMEFDDEEIPCTN